MTSRFNLKKGVRIAILSFLIFWMILSLNIWLLSHLSIANFLLQIFPKSFIKGTNVLIMGLDGDQTSQRSDTMMVLHLNTESEKIGLLSIPRDTKVFIDELGFTKINHAYAKGHASLAKSAVSSLLDIPIHHSIIVDISGLADIINQLGGISVTIKKPLHYVDRAGKLYIDLQPGTQTLNGDQALQYLRFRHDEQGDIGRITRQQNFISAFKNKLQEAQNILKLPTLIFSLRTHIQSDLSASEMIRLAYSFQSVLSQGQIEGYTLPGTGETQHGVSYWITSQDDIAAAVQELMSPGHTKTPPRSIPSSEFSAEMRAPIRLEILNGIDIPSAAKRAKEYFESKGIQVVHIGNAGDYNYQQTMLIDWKGNIDAVLPIANLLSIDPARIIVYDRPDKISDVTLVIGQDWPAIRSRLSQISTVGL